MYRRLYGKGIEKGQRWDREDTGKVTDYKEALWVMT